MSLLSKASSWIYRGWYLSKAAKKPCFPEPLQLGETPRILAFTCAGIGDTLTDSVVFKALKERWPGGFLGAVVHRRRKFLVSHNPHIDKIFTFQKGPHAFWKLQLALKNGEPWDAILHLRGNDPEPRCLSWSIAPNRTVSTPNMTTLSELCGHQVLQPDWDETHGVEQTLRLARYLGAETKSPRLVYTVSSEEVLALENKVSMLWAGTKFDVSKSRIVFQVGGGRRAAWRDWPAQRYAELILLLSKKVDAEFILLAGPEKVLQRKAEEITGLVAERKKSLHLRNAVGKLNLAESASLLASSRVLVSTDTGIMHLGFAVGTRVVALIHYRNPASRVGPYGYGDWHLVHQLERGSGKNSNGMEDITAEAVAQSVLKIWESSS